MAITCNATNMMSFDYNVEAEGWTGSSIHGGLMKKAQVVVDDTAYSIKRKNGVLEFANEGGMVAATATSKGWSWQKYTVEYKGDSYKFEKQGIMTRSTQLVSGNGSKVTFNMNHAMSKNCSIPQEEAKLFDRELVMMAFWLHVSVLAMTAGGGVATM